MASILRHIGLGGTTKDKETAEPVHEFITGIHVVSDPQPPTSAIVEYELMHPRFETSANVGSIIFLHGITGNREATWTAKGAPGPWPSQFLPPVLPRARIMLFGYDARVVDWRALVAQGGIDSHSKSLLNALGNHRDADGSVYTTLHTGSLVRLTAYRAHAQLFSWSTAWED
jgi:hypothetical protein